MLELPAHWRFYLSGRRGMLKRLYVLSLLMICASSAWADTKGDCNQHGDLDLSIRSCTQLIRQDPRDYQAYTSRGVSYGNKKDPDRAIADYTKAIEIKSDFSDAIINRANEYRTKGEYDRAIGEYDRVLALNRSRYVLTPFGQMVAYHNRGLAYHLKGDLDRAIQDYDRALQTQQAKRGNTYYLRGWAYYRKRDFENAIRDYTAALDLEPNNTTYLSSLEKAKTARSEEQRPQPDARPPGAVPPADIGRRVALVIGNSAYRAVPPLDNPRRDAETVAAALRAVGFQTVTLNQDLRKEELVSALRSFAHQADAADWAIIYYAGHGIEMGGTNYLVPIDAKLDTDKDVTFEAVPLDQAITAVEGARKLRLVLLDACRDNPFARQMRRTTAARSIGRGLGAIEPEAGTLVVYAAKHGEIALDGPGANSPFVTSFVKEIRRPGIEIRKLFDLVRDDVMEITGKKQQPFTYGSLSGREDYFFAAK
jgi:tetratricopeptide (TPR) repeat protein